MKRLNILLTLALALSLGTGCVGQHAINEARGKDYALNTLRQMYGDLKRSYYDPTFHGQDMERHYNAARAAITNAQSDQERFRALHGFLLPLDDSHTIYLGGNNFSLQDYGFSFRFYGEEPYVSAVDWHSSADSSGLRRGDAITAFDHKPLTRDNYLATLVQFLGQDPIPPLTISVRGADNSVSDITLIADTLALRRMKGGEFRKLYSTALDSAKRAQSHISASIMKKVFYWKIPEFAFADIKLGHLAREAAKHETLILDLRGNPGGPIDQLKEVMNFFVAQPLTIGTVQSRWDKDTYVSKPKGDAYKGQILVLIDSETGSAAEVCARLLQLDRHATVIGDRSAGAVMVASMYGMASITISDFVLHNGERLEKHGVIPDLPVLPTQQDVAGGRDPVLAFALRRAGVAMSPVQAGKIASGGK